MPGMSPLGRMPLGTAPRTAIGSLAATLDSLSLAASASATAGAALAPVVAQGGLPLGAGALGGSAAPKGVTLAASAASLAKGQASVVTGPAALAASGSAPAVSQLSATLGPVVATLSATSIIAGGQLSVTGDPVYIGSSGSSKVPAVVLGTDHYLGLIAPEHTGKPKFEATVALSVDPMARLCLALRKLALVHFDLDTAVGPQLDAVGVRVGRSRDVPYPLQGLFFTWGDANRGWGRGVWKGPFDYGSSIYRLDDETYRRLLRAKILANAWDGTVEGLEAIYSVYFTDPETLIFVTDDAYSAKPQPVFAWGDPARGWGLGVWDTPDGAPFVPSFASTGMKLTVGFAGKIPSIIDLAILDEGLVGAKPEGVGVDIAVTSVDDAPLFGWGSGNDFVSGWGAGAWAAEPAALMAQPPA